MATFQPGVSDTYGTISNVSTGGSVNLTYPNGQQGFQGMYQIDVDTWKNIPPTGKIVTVPTGKILMIKAALNSTDNNGADPGTPFSNMVAKFIFTWDQPNQPQVTIEARVFDPPTPPQS